MFRPFTTRWRSRLAQSAIVVALQLLAACSHEAVGPVRTEQRGVDAFHSIDLRGAADATVQVGPVASVTLIADAETLKTTGTRVQNGMLVIENQPGWNWLGSAPRVEARISLPVLNAIEKPFV